MARCFVIAVSLGVAAVACDGSPTPPTSLTINGVTPDTLVEGASATLTGSGFSSTPANNIVRIGSLAATVTSATTTSLTVTVPRSNCQPEGSVGLRVIVDGNTSNTVTTSLRPASLLNLAVGEHLIIQDPEQFCLQFPPSFANGDAYLIGVGTTVWLRPEPDHVEQPYDYIVPFTMTGVPESPAAAMLSSQPVSIPAPAPRIAFQGWGIADAKADDSQLRNDIVQRKWERELFQRVGPSARLAKQHATPVVQAPPAPAVGDTIRFNIPAGSTAWSSCDTFVNVSTVVRAVGETGIWVTDAANPVIDALTMAEIQALSDTFDLHIYPVDAMYFGPLSDIDLNQHVYIVLTIEVNRQGSSSIVWGGDLFFDRSFCTQSNGGEIIYIGVPDPGNVAGRGAQSKSAVLDRMPRLMAHQLTHSMQLSRRFGGGTIYDLMPLWEMEGQAMLGEEVVGHRFLGNSAGQNYGASVVFAPGASRWYQRPFQQLASYFGWMPGGPAKVANAPEMCSLYPDVVTSCDPLAFQGAAWAFMRYLGDRFGSIYPGGEAGLHRDIIGGIPPLGTFRNLEDVVGTDFDSLFAQWAAALYVDDRGAAGTAPLAMSSWDFLDVFSAFGSDAFRLTPVERTVRGFTDARAVRGGSTAYTRLTTAGPHPAFAIRVRDATDELLNPGKSVHIWVTRLQ